MPFNFSLLVKQPVQFVPYVPQPQSGLKSTAFESDAVGHNENSNLAAMSKALLMGQYGQVRTFANSQQSDRTTHCLSSHNNENGHIGQPGHAISLEQQATFEERAAIIEFDGQLNRAEAEQMAWREINALLNLPNDFGQNLGEKAWVA